MLFISSAFFVIFLIKCTISILIFKIFHYGFIFKVNQKKGSATKSARKNRRSSFAQGRKKRKSLLFSSAPEKSGKCYLIYNNYCSFVKSFFICHNFLGNFSRVA